MSNDQFKQAARRGKKWAQFQTVHIKKAPRIPRTLIFATRFRVLFSGRPLAPSTFPDTLRARPAAIATPLAPLAVEGMPRPDFGQQTLGYQPFAGTAGFLFFRWC